MTDRALLQRLLPAMERACSYYDLYEECDLVRERLAQPDKKQRQWQGLSRLEFQKAVEGLEDLEDCWISIEAALREKNT